MARRAQVNAIEEEQLRAVLRSLGVADAYESGELRCSVCAQPVREVGVGSVRMEEGRLVFVCRRLQCMEHMYD